MKRPRLSLLHSILIGSRGIFVFALASSILSQVFTMLLPQIVRGAVDDLLDRVEINLIMTALAALGVSVLAAGFRYFSIVGQRKAS